MAGVLGDREVDAVKLTPGHLQLADLADLCEAVGLRVIVVGGEELKTALVREIGRLYRSAGQDLQ